ncbi:MAG: hypothetical protein EOM64_07095 [Erysipelotrichia bacterium]|nr:hypothetical protein [Erysipelotrichia bacterium]
MTFVSISTALLILMIVIQELKYWKSVKIITIKSKSEIMVMAVSIISITAMMLILAKTPVHYFIGCLGILFFAADIQKQGISAKGIMIVARGKQLYQWHEIDHAEIVLSKQLKICFFSKSNSKIATQLYPCSMQDKIVRIFNENTLPFQTANM